MAEARRSTLATAVLATAGSLGLHAALLSIALRHAGPAVEPPPRAPVVLSLPGPALVRPAAVEPPAEAVDVPSLPVPAPVESAAAATAGLAEVPSSGPQAADAPAAEPAAVPPAPADAPAVVPDAPASVEPAPPSRLFEATSPARVAPPPGLPVPAEATAATQLVALQEGVPPNAVDQVAPDRSRAALPVHLPPAVGPTREPAAVALREASPDVGPALSPMPPETTSSSGSNPLSVAAAPAIPPPAADPTPGPAEALSPAAGASSTAAAESDVPAALGAVQTKEAVVAALEAPTVSAERIRGFVERYDGGPCFFASLTGTGPTGAGIETFSVTVDQVMAFHAAFMGQLGVEPAVVGQRVWSAQCPAVELLRTNQARDGIAPKIEIGRREMHAGDLLTGVVKNVGQADVALLMVSETGAITNLSDVLGKDAMDRPFAWRPSSRAGIGPYPQILVAAFRTPSSKAPSTPLADVAQDLLRSSQRTRMQSRTGVGMVGAFFLLVH